MAFRVLFFGTPAFAVPSLARLLASRHHVAAVVTQPDRRRGRGQQILPGPIKTLAEAHGMPVLQPERLKDEAFLSSVRAASADLAIVAAYGRLLPQTLLDIPARGVLNVHASILPRWRGAAPVHRAVIAGDHTTGVTIMRVVLALDAGPMLARRETAIDPDETSVTLEARLAGLGADLLAETLDRLEHGSVPEEPQDERLVTYATKLERKDSAIDWTQTAQAIHDRIRGLHPWPLAAARLNDRRVSLLRSAPVPHDSGSAPGSIVEVTREGFLVAAGRGAVRVLELQEAGRAPMTSREYLNGRRVRAGDRLEPLDDPS
jgi:methionyl-tRNA formyltransferase